MSQKSFSDVTIVSRVFAPEPVAAAYQLKVLRDNLLQDGRSVTVITSKYGSLRSERAQRVFRWPVLRDKQGVVRGYLQYLSFDIPMFFRLLTVKKTDVVVVQPPPTTGFFSRLACWLKRKPYIYYADDVLTSAVRGAGINKIVTRVVHALEKFSLKGAKAIVTISDEVKQEIIELFGSDLPISVVGTGVDTSVFNMDSATESTDSEKYLIYAGTYSEVHGAEIFLEAFNIIKNEFPSVRIKFYGQGTADQQLKQYVKNHNLRVDFHSLVSPTEIAIILRNAVAGLASIRPNSGYDFAFTTKAFAMTGCGLPVLYAGPGPVGEMIRANSLGIWSSWQAKEVAEAMRTMLSQPFNQTERIRISEWVDSQYSLSKVAENIKRVIDSV